MSLNVKWQSGQLEGKPPTGKNQPGVTYVTNTYTIGFKVKHIYTIKQGQNSVRLNQTVIQSYVTPITYTTVKVSYL